jgi:predicted NAD-dependent protein-ADP-ribosyltransferase YbiA (DUF1768 family)
MQVFTFFTKKKLGQELSNFWEGQVVVDDRIYSNGELAFHGSKYVVISQHTEDQTRRQTLLDYGKEFEQGGKWGELSGSEAKRKGGKKGLALTGKELAIWDSASEVVQEAICRHKQATDPAVKKALQETAGMMLVHPAMRCSLEKAKQRKWEGRVVEDDAGRMIVVGGNRLGAIWMKVRDDS